MFMSPEEKKVAMVTVQQWHHGQVSSYMAVMADRIVEQPPRPKIVGVDLLLAVVTVW